MIGRHTLKTASVLNEFRVGECKVDVAILNGTSTAYEIKSERDNLSRLSSQLSAYRDVFAKTFVIAGENHGEDLTRFIPSDVGILRLTSRGRISTLREATDRKDCLRPLAILDSVRTAEAKQMLNYLGKTIPEGPNTVIREMLGEAFRKLTPTEAHAAMVVTLKGSRNSAHLSDLIHELPKSLSALVLSIQPTRNDTTRLVNALNTSLDDAVNWA